MTRNNLNFESCDFFHPFHIQSVGPSNVIPTKIPVSNPISSKHQATPFHSASSLGTKIWCHPNIRAASISNVANKSPKIPSGFFSTLNQALRVWISLTKNEFEKVWRIRPLTSLVLYKYHQKIRNIDGQTPQNPLVMARYPFYALVLCLPKRVI